MIQCPVCGSEEVKPSEKLTTLSVPYGPDAAFLEQTCTCGSCKESGDFAGVNDARITEAVAIATKASIDPILAHLENNGIREAYVERVLWLPSGTLTRWRKEGASAEGMALLRIIRTFPAILDVADKGYGDKGKGVTKDLFEVILAGSESNLFRRDERAQSDQSLFSLLVDSLVGRPQECLDYPHRLANVSDPLLHEAMGLIVEAFNTIDWVGLSDEARFATIDSIAVEELPVKGSPAARRAAHTLRWAVANHQSARKRSRS